MAQLAQSGTDYFWGWNLGKHRDILAIVGRSDPQANTRIKGLTKMASDRQNLQDVFLNHVRKTKVPVTIFLINGVKLQGVINWFDNFCVLLRRDGQSQLVYKHAISTIMPSQPISLYEGEDAS